MNDDHGKNYAEADIEDIVEALTDDERSEFSGNEQSDELLFKEDSVLIEPWDLSLIPVSEWKSIRVSNRSFFLDEVWDFQDEVAYQGVFRYSFSKELPDGSFLTDSKNENLGLLFRSVVHYYLPHNDIFSRHQSTSYVSVVRVASTCFHIICWLFRIGMLEDNTDCQMRTAPSISEAEIDRFVRELPKNVSFAQAERIIYVLEHWFDLSRAGVMPVEFSLFVSARRGRGILEIYPDYEQSDGWKPIPADVLYPLVKGSLTFLEERADDIIDLIEVWAAGYAEGTDHYSRAYSRRKRVKAWVNQFGESRFLDPNGQRWVEVPKGGPNGNYRVAWVYELARALSAACWTLIIFPMGFRRSEVGELEVGCSRVVNDETNECRIRVKIFKTSQGSRGEIVDLPCPPITHFAIMLMERLTSFTRAPGETKLFTNIRHGRQRWVGNFIDDLALLCGFLSIQEVPHTHQFRKTIASFFVYQNPQNIYLLKRLFSHASLRMTMKYISSIKTISREIREYISGNNRKLLKELFKSAIEGNISGHGGIRISRSVRERFKGLSQDDVMESADTYVEALLESGVAMLHRTPLCICTKTPSLTQKAPCDPVNPTVQTRLRPRVNMCVPWDCNFAAFTPENLEAVRNDVEFHTKFLERPNLNDAQRRVSDRIVKRGKEILSDLSPEVTLLSGDS